MTGQTEFAVNGLTTALYVFRGFLFGFVYHDQRGGDFIAVHIQDFGFKVYRGAAPFATAPKIGKYPSTFFAGRGILFAVFDLLVPFHKFTMRLRTKVANFSGAKMLARNGFR